MKSKLLALALACVATIILSGCAGGNFTPLNVREMIARNPEANKGMVIGFGGTLLGDAEESGDGTTVFQVKDYNMGTSWVVTYPGRIPYSMRSGNGVQLIGRVEGSVTGTNAFGGSVRAISVNALFVSVATGKIWVKSELATIEAWQAANRD